MEFVSDSKSRKDTAILLTGTAAEFGVNQRDIRAVQGGFYISDELATILARETKKTSGNRAAKKNSKEE